MSYQKPTWPGAEASRQLYARACDVLPGGNTRTTVYMDPYPIYARRGYGCHIVDVDGNDRLDFLGNHTSLIHGYQHPTIIEAIDHQLAMGTCFPMPTELEIELAEILCDRLPSVDRIWFVSSGSEAVQLAIKAARAFTGRAKIAKAEGAYHGTYDPVQFNIGTPPIDWSEPPSGPTPAILGIPTAVSDNTIVFPFNDVGTAERILEEQGTELAAIIVDPVPNRAGLIPATEDFLRMLRRTATKIGAVLVFDEVISFRVSIGGAQQVFGVLPDVTTLGKIIGGGMPIGAVGGTEEIMRVFSPRGAKPSVPHGGTFNGNPMSMAAGLAAMRLLTPETFKRLAHLGEQMRCGLTAALESAGVEGCVTGMSSLARIHLRASPIDDYQAAFQGPLIQQRMRALFGILLAHGVIMSPTGLCCLSTPMEVADLETLFEAVERGLRSLKEGDWAESTTPMR